MEQQLATLSSIIAGLKTASENNTSKIISDMNELRNSFLITEKKIDDIKLFHEQLITELHNTKERIQTLEQKTNDAVNLLNMHEKIINSIRREKSIIIHNLETQGNSMENVESSVLQLFTEKLNVQIDIRDIDFITQIGKGGKNNKPILVKFLSLRIKQKILKSSYLLKGTQTKISRDFSRTIRDRRKLLIPYLLQAKQLNISAKLINDQIVIGGKKYHLEDLASIEPEHLPDFIKKSNVALNENYIYSTDSDEFESKEANSEQMKQVKPVNLTKIVKKKRNRDQLSPRNGNNEFKLKKGPRERSLTQELNEASNIEKGRSFTDSP